jgi:hypothetical protein
MKSTFYNLFFFLCTFAVFVGCVNHTTAPSTKNAPIDTIKIHQDTITPPTLAQLQSMKTVNLQFLGRHNYTPNGQGVLDYFFGGIPTWNFTATNLIWDGTIFTGDISGTINFSLTRIDTFNFSREHGSQEYDPQTGRFIRNTSVSYGIEGFNIPLSNVNADSVTFLIKGPSVHYFLSNIYLHAYILDRSGEGRSDYISTSWQDTSTTPVLKIKFSK